MWNEEQQWVSELVPEMLWEPEPRREPDYDGRARDLFRAQYLANGDEISAGNVAKWPLMRLERAILRTGLWRRLGTQEASHTVRYICHLLPSVEPEIRPHLRRL